MDQDEELKRFKWILSSGLVFLISGCFSYTELKYAIRGKTTEAQVSEFKEYMGGRRSNSPKVDLRYTYLEADGTSRGGRDDVPRSWVPDDPKSVTIQYIPGVEDSSRIKASERLMPVYFFAATALWLGYSIFTLAREANTPIARGPGRRSG